MPEFRIRVSRVQVVTQDAFVVVTADSPEAAVEQAYDLDSDKIDWRTQERETESWDVDESSVKETTPA